MTTPQEERDAALTAYRSASAEFEAAQAAWDPFLAPTATVILVAQATQFGAPVQVTGQPDQGSIKVRTVEETQTASGSFGWMRPLRSSTVN